MAQDKTVITLELFGVNRHFDNAQDFVKHVNKIWKQVPDEYKEDASIDFYGFEDYGSCHAAGDIYYIRPETEEETKKREEKIQSEKQSLEENERQLYLKLKKKYGENM